jgi:hypothetical protein
MPEKNTGPAASQPTEPPICADLQERFDEASLLRIPPYNWAPPEWEKLESRDTNPGFPDNCHAEGAFERTRGDVTAPLAQLSNAVGEMMQRRSLVSPLEDFGHIDPDQFSDEDIERLREPPSNPHQDRALSLRKLRDLAGSESRSMSRLDGVFKWILATFQRLCLQLNQTLDDRNRSLEQRMKTYGDLRKEYIERLRDLDDHEPQRKGMGGLVEPGVRGYGRIVKWVHVAPAIANGRIVELRVIVHWNPHSSSSGKPILHA